MKRVNKTPTAIARSAAPFNRPGFGQEEIARLAYLNWRHDGCPAGRDVQYWLEAECQIKATWHLLAAAGSPVDSARP